MGGQHTTELCEGSHNLDVNMKCPLASQYTL